MSVQLPYSGPLFEYVFRLSRKTLADERAAVWDCVGVAGAQGGHHSRASYHPLKPSVVGYLTVRRAGAAVSASQPAEYHARTQRDDPAAAGRSHHRTRWLRDHSGFAPFLSPVMFFLNENSWPAITLIVSLAAILLTTLIVVGWRRDA